MVSSIVMKIKAINNFNLPIKKVGVWKYAGFLSRKSHVFVKYEDNNEELLNYKQANDKFMTTISTILTDDEFQMLNRYRNKIEKPNEFSVTLAKNVIEDYNFDYNDKSWYNSTPQFNLVKFEQLLIQNSWEANCIDKFTKPIETKINGHDISDIILNITEFKYDRISSLKVYIDEFFQYLFDIPKNIWRINNLDLPVSKNERTHLEIQQYASYLNRKSQVNVTMLNYTIKVKNVDANESFMTWFSSFTSNEEDLLQLKNYRYKIENLSDNDKVIELGKEFVKDYEYDNEDNSEKKQFLINLEQFLIRYNIPTSYVLDCMKSKNSDYFNSDVIKWVSKLTNKKKSEKLKLKNYLDEYLSHTVNRSKNEFDKRNG